MGEALSSSAYVAASLIREMSQPFARLGHIPSAEELIEIAFRRASKSQKKVPKGPLEIRIRAKERDRIRIAGHEIAKRLRKVVARFPDVKSLHPFYRELADILVGLDELKKALGALNKASRVISSLRRSYLLKLRRAKTIKEMGLLRREAYGRMASVVKRIAGYLDFLRKAASRLARLPSIEPDAPTIVVAGYANVGKSSLVRAVSSAKPEVASYPFTTKDIVVGHRETPHGRVQIIDTPGLLDRPLSERNRIELQAILALKYLARAIIFLIDPTSTCGYPLESQLKLLEEVRKGFPAVPLLVAINKADIATGEQIKAVREALRQEAYVISALRGDGIEELVEEAIKAVFAEDEKA